MDTIRLTGRHKTHEAWHGDLSLYLKPGDSVGEQLQRHFLEVVPLTSWKWCIIQLGAAADHSRVRGRTRFETIQKHGAQWVYTGARTRGEYVYIDELGTKASLLTA